MSTFIRLTYEEACVLWEMNNESNLNSCPGGYHTPERKIWWGLMISGKFIYSICQTCYHNNRFGNNNMTIKSQLKPYIVENMLCNCDGLTEEEAYPSIFINDNHKIMVGVYNILPAKKINDAKVGSIITSEDKLVYAIRILCKKLNNTHFNPLNIKYQIFKIDDNGNKIELQPYYKYAFSGKDITITLFGTHVANNNSFQPLLYTKGEYHKYRSIITIDERITSFEIDISNSNSNSNKVGNNEMNDEFNDTIEIEI